MRTWIPLLLGSLCLPLAPAHAGLDDLMKGAEKYLGGDSAATAGAGLTDAQIDEGLKKALKVGTNRAVELLSTDGGFLNDPSVRIPLPGELDKIGKTMRKFGLGSQVDEFETTMNRAAEMAMPETKRIVKKTINNMSLEDVRGILSGGDDAATQFLREKAGGDLREAILPVVSDATDKAGATAAYKGLKSSADSTLGGMVDTGSMDLDQYVTDKAMDGLFEKLALEEKRIREDPVARTSDILKQVFSN